MTAPCPSDLSLERHLLARDAALGEHVEKCPSCAARLARMREEGDDFRRFVFPATVDAIEDAAERRRKLPLFLAPAAAFAAIATAVVLVWNAPQHGPPEGYVGTMGGPLTLAVFVDTKSGVRAVEDHAKVPPDAAIRFKVGAKGCRLWVVSVDAAGEVSKLFPSAGRFPAEIPTGGDPLVELPGGAVLDGTPGPERLYAVCAESSPLPWPDLVRAVKDAAGGGAERVRAAGRLSELPPDASQVTLLLEKTL
jgi:hypothetical protein